MCSLGADPYFTIEYEGEKVRSHTVNNNLNPEWDASATFYRKNPHSDILIEVRMSLFTICFNITATHNYKVKKDIK